MLLMTRLHMRYYLMQIPEESLLGITQNCLTYENFLSNLHALVILRTVQALY